MNLRSSEVLAGLCKRFTVRIALAAGVAALALAISACGSSGGSQVNSTSSTASGSAANAASTVTGSNSGRLDTAAAQKYLGAKTGVASGSPVVFGLVNDNGGPIESEPEIDPAVQAAAKYVNENFGGYGGHPIAIKTCDISVEEQGVSCAQEFLADPAIQVILAGSLAVGGASFYQTIGGKKLVFSSGPWAPSDLQARNAYFVSTGELGAVAAYAAYMTGQSHAKTVAISGIAGNRTVTAIIQGLEAALHPAGIKTTVVQYPPTTTDLLAPLKADGVQTADGAIALVPGPAQCIAVAKAIQELGVQPAHVLEPFFCASGPVKQELGDYPKFAYLFFTLNPLDPDPAGQVNAYLQAMARYAPAGANVGLFAPEAFGLTMAAAKIGDELNGTSDPSAFASKIKALSGEQFLLPPMKFGSVPGLPTVGGGTVRFYVYEGNGKWKDEGWVTPPAHG